MTGGSIPVRVANQNKKENDEISLKTWIGIAILDILVHDFINTVTYSPPRRGER